MLTANYYGEENFTGNTILAALGTQIAIALIKGQLISERISSVSKIPQREYQDEESMKTENFIQRKDLGNEIAEIISLGKKFFQGCKCDLAVKYVDEIGKDILEIRIISKFDPEETAKKEWEFLGEAVKKIPPQKTRLLSIFAEVT